MSDDPREKLLDELTAALRAQNLAAAEVERRIAEVRKLVADKDIPFPTRHRLDLGHSIANGWIRHYHWVSPSTFHTITGREVTSRVRELVEGRLAVVGEADDSNTSFVRLTEQGEAWLDTYGKNGADTS